MRNLFAIILGKNMARCFIWVMYICIDTPCVGKARSQLKRFMRRELVALFEENGIYRIPETFVSTGLSSKEFNRLVYGKDDPHTGGDPGKDEADWEE